MLMINRWIRKQLQGVAINLMRFSGAAFPVAGRGRLNIYQAEVFEPDTD